MWVFIITFAGAAVIALLGWWSAKVASAEAKAKMIRAQPDQATQARSSNIDDKNNIGGKNQDNPAAMAMAGPAGANSQTR